MEIPEKVYINDFGSELSSDWHRDRCAENDIEYIRRDVFMEKVFEFFEDHLCCYIGAQEFTIDEGRLETECLIFTL